MAQSLNKQVDLTIKATSFLGLTSTGKVMIGDKAFEFYNDRNVEDFIQIPWDRIDRIEASVIGKREYLDLRYSWQMTSISLFQHAIILRL